ncbi:citrulline utilization hydrolase CtlX [Agaribacter flavus]|uniref:Citrulline utilization hydrolase CtlX n=1 Tax=Agaribacter flavus TaxID=1902781 RepID=A0ABV7FU94_9ALTE
MSESVLNAQAPSSVIMVRPHRFSPNTQTSADNSFQRLPKASERKNLAVDAYRESSLAEKALRAHGIQVHMFEDTTTETPDSVFPNNWFSTHHNGQVAIYPMYAENRRKERRTDIIDLLKQQYHVCQIVDYSACENDGLFLEGTGAMVIDHITQTVFVIESKRANKALVDMFCNQFNYQSVMFEALDQRGKPIYHTNVFMGIATEFAVLAPDMIVDRYQRDSVIERLSASGRKIVALSPQQVNAFAGNCIELNGTKGRLLALSQTAFETLTPSQVSTIEESATLLPIDVSTLELAGGSIRCMIAGIHLRPRAIHN